MTATATPFYLDNEHAYRTWREHKLSAHPARLEDLVVAVNDPRALSTEEKTALLDRLQRSNMAIYAGAYKEEDKDIPRLLGKQFGLVHLDANWLADEDGISSLEVAEAAETRREFIPYTSRAIRWHTDGYYNPPARRIWAMVLHCVRDAKEGGHNALMDHEMAYLLLRDENPEHIRALMAPDAMTIPAREDESGVARAAEPGPVFLVDETTGALHMRYTARTRSIEWKNDTATRAAVTALEKLLASDSPYIFRGHLAPGMGLICNNVLHDRSGFNDDPAHPRLLYRARYLDWLDNRQP